MSIKTRLDKLECTGSPYVGLAERLKEANARRKAGLQPITTPRTEEELNVIIATSKNKLGVRLADIYLRRLKA
ncbi:MAG: hypothetical protein WCP01_17050 [Methylococcaceae bacterium]